MDSRVRPNEFALMVDAGDFLGGSGADDELKADYLVRGLTLMGATAMNLGEMDFLRGQAFLKHLEQDYGAPLISANILVASTRRPFVSPYRIVRLGGHRWHGLEWGGVRVGIFGVTSNEHPPLRALPSDAALIIDDPSETTARMVGELSPRCDILIALSHLGLEESEALASRFPTLSVVVSGHGRLRLDGLRRDGPVVVVHARSQGEYIGDLALLVGAHGRVMEARAEQVPLDDHIADDENLAALVDQYREAARAARRPAVSAPPVVAGASACSSCHASEYAQWAGSGHARAIEALRGTPDEGNAACLPCHTTGFGMPGGFTALASTPATAGVQCESCHGPALGHVRFHQGQGVTPYRYKLLAGNRAEDCAACHNEEQDAEFNFASELPLVSHAAHRPAGK